MLFAECSEQPATLDAGKLPVIAGEDHLGAGHPGFREQFAGDAGVQHRRLVDDEHGTPVPLCAPVLQPEELGMHCAGLGEPIGAQVLRHGIGRRQTNHAPAGQFVRVADGLQGVTP